MGDDRAAEVQEALVPAAEPRLAPRPPRTAPRGRGSAKNSVGRLGRTEEIADLVAYLASPRAGYVTGANFRIDGGSTTSVN